MNEVSTFRLYLLRAMYLLMAVGLGIFIWPGLISPPDNLSNMAGVVRAVLGGISLMALLGLRYPLKMLPILFFELTWKLLWVLLIGLPAWLGDRLDENMAQTFFDCMVGVVLVPIAIPWGYAWRHYVLANGDRWRASALAGS